MTRALIGWVRSGVVLIAVVAAVASIPALLLWLFAPDDAVTSVAPEVLVAPPELPPRSEPVTFTNGVMPLAGALHLPAGEGPHPAVVVVHGSGPETAERLAPIGERLAGGGIAVLTYDKRGVGRSGGTYRPVGTANSEQVLSELAEDVLAAVEFLRAQRDVRRTRIGLVGLSQGGWIAPIAASRSDAVAFMILYSGPTVTVGEEIYYSELTGDELGQTGLSDPQVAERLAGYDGPRGFDPVPVLESLEIPALWILGGRDRSIPVRESVAILDALRSAGKPFSYHLIPDADHSLTDFSGRRVPTWPVVAQWLEDRGLHR